MKQLLCVVVIVFLAMGLVGVDAFMSSDQSLVEYGTANFADNPDRKNLDTSAQQTGKQEGQLTHPGEVRLSLGGSVDANGAYAGSQTTLEASNAVKGQMDAKLFVPRVCDPWSVQTLEQISSSGAFANNIPGGVGVGSYTDQIQKAASRLYYEPGSFAGNQIDAQNAANSGATFRYNADGMRVDLSVGTRGQQETRYLSQPNIR